MINIREALKEMNIEHANTTASFQGFGNVARYAIELYQQMGGKTVCVSSWNQEENTSYAYYKKDGINLEELTGITDTFGGINKNQAADLGYQILNGEEWLTRDVTILVPAALENQITVENAGRISRTVKIIAEGANGPTTPEADQIINEQQIMVIPDLLANAGGVTCSYFEQVQSNMNYFWEKDEILSKLDVKMTAAFIAVNELARRSNLNFRDAAYVISVDRVVQASRERGWV